MVPAIQAPSGSVFARDGTVTIGGETYEPQEGPQTALIDCDIFEVLYGGAVYGGKTFGFILDWLFHEDEYGPYANGIWVRRQRTPDLDHILEKSSQIFPQFGAHYDKQHNVWQFESGAKLFLRPLWNLSDADSYLSHEYSRVYAEELTTWPDPAPLFRIMERCRSAKGVIVGFRANSNPGSIGHTWVKQRYIDPHPAGFKPIYDKYGNCRVYIPSRFWDNKIGLSQDPNYPQRVAGANSTAVALAKLGGDWNQIEGQFFDCWSQTENVLPPFQPPEHWTRIQGYDYGFSAPFSFGWWVVASEDTIIGGRRVPRGALVCYREWYGAEKDEQGNTKPNVGLKMKLSDVRKGVLDREKGEHIHVRYADPSIFKADDGPSIDEQLGLGMTPADNKRIPGWQEVYGRIAGENGTPMLFVCSNCPDTIRTLPAMPHDRHNSEDIDTDAEDHAPDQVRYVCTGRPWVSKKREEKAPKPRDYGIREQTEEPTWCL